jgi:hypothetical protein
MILCCRGKCLSLKYLIVFTKLFNQILIYWKNKLTFEMIKNKNPENFWSAQYFLSKIK